MKKAGFLLSVIMLSFSFLFAQPPPKQMINIEVIVGNKQPSPNEVQLMKIEEANHPNITNAIHEIEKSMKSLYDAPDDFGGHKAQAETDLKQAWLSLRKALYYRLYQDTQIVPK
jgi:hypothetical protein